MTPPHGKLRLVNSIHRIDVSAARQPLFGVVSTRRIEAAASLYGVVLHEAGWRDLLARRREAAP